MDTLPIESHRDEVLMAVARGPVVITSPTGSGKSTQVPRWLAPRGPVLVVQPRRVACKALAQRVAELEGTRLGDRVGYIVRDDRRATATTAIVFVTTGVALRLLRGDDADRFSFLVLDELHERSMDLDLLLALQARRPGLVLMSATLDAERVTDHVGGTWVSAAGRTHPVTIRHPPGQPAAPSLDRLPARIRSALDSLGDDDGDVLVFLPGKAEIASVADHLRGRFPVVPLHGGLSLAEQGAAFATEGPRKVILSTNVAETSVTLPRITAVIDAGLVRRTRYHRGRSVLTLVPVARDAADQRAGRAGRLRPGVALRLWSERAPLDPHTPPEIHRESLVPLVLAAAAMGAHELDLPWLDPPKDHALTAAQDDLRALGAIDGAGRLTPTGDQLFGLPLDPALGRLLVQARGTDQASVVADLVAALTARRPLFRSRPDDPDDDLRASGCDAVAMVRAVREGHPGRHRLDAHILREVRVTQRRLRALLGVTSDLPVDRRALARCILAAWPDAAHVARRHGRRVGWSNGGTELELGRDVALAPDKVDERPFALVLDTRATGRHRLEQRLLATALMPVPKEWLVEAGLGRDHLAEPALRRGVVTAAVERVYAGRVLDRREAVPEGDLARQATAALFLRGSLFGAATTTEARERLDARTLWARLNDEPAPPSLEEWVPSRLRELGLERGDEVELLSRDDLLPDDLDPWAREKLERTYPRRLDLPDASYRLQYHPQRRVVELVQVRGARKTPPPLRFVPTLPGWRVELVHKNVRRTLRR